MASISGFGNIGGIPEGIKRNPGVAKKEAEVNPQVGSDALSINFQADPGLAPRETKQAAPTPAQSPSAAPAETARPQARPSVPVNLSMEDGLFGIQSVGSSAASDKIGLSSFTNGLGSTQIMSISGRVLADANPMRNH